jgi:hypothetical protein
LLAISSVLAVINAKNTNDDGMDGEICLAIADSLKNKYINIGHNRTKTCGHVVSTGFSKFSPNYAKGVGSELLAEENVKDLRDPFNLCYAGVLFRLVADDLCSAIEESNNPESDSYLGISSSWEVGFEDYNIAIGGIYLKDCELITPTDKSFAELDKLLKANDGPGKKGTDYVWRVVAGRPIFLGAGLTDNPASQVAGVITAENKESKATVAVDIDLNTKIADLTNKILESESIIKESADKLLPLIDKLQDEISAEIASTPNSSVISDSNNSKILIYMDKIKDIKDITDENLKVIKADKITDFISDELRKASESFTVQITEKEGLLTKTKEQLTSLSAEHDTLKKNLETLSAELNTLKTQATEREKNEIFSSRMATLDEKFELTDEDRQIIASQIRELDEAGFTGWEKNMSILMKDKSKATRKTAVASATPTPQAAVDAAIDNGTKSATIPNTSTSTQSESFAEKIKKDPKLAYSINLGKK